MWTLFSHCLCLLVLLYQKRAQSATQPTNFSSLEILFQELFNQNNNTSLPLFVDSLPVIAVLALGPNSGLAQMKNGFIMGEFITTKLKSKDLLVSRYWSDLGQKMPKH